MDFFKRLRQNQKSVEEKLSLSLRPRFQKSAVAILRGQATKQKFETNAVAVDILAENQVDRDMHVAVRGYADWLATKLWRQSNGKPLPATTELPECTVKDREAIAKKYNIKPSVVKAVTQEIEWRKKHTKLWPVGVISNGTVEIHAGGLTKWASHYDWSKQPQPAKTKRPAAKPR